MRDFKEQSQARPGPYCLYSSTEALLSSLMLIIPTWTAARHCLDLECLRVASAMGRSKAFDSPSLATNPDHGCIMILSRFCPTHHQAFDPSLHGLTASNPDPCLIQSVLTRYGQRARQRRSGEAKWRLWLTGGLRWTVLTISSLTS